MGHISHQVVRNALNIALHILIFHILDLKITYHTSQFDTR
jgi:hypothetical protein